jgi:hypothetical protein
MRSCWNWTVVAAASLWVAGCGGGSGAAGIGGTVSGLGAGLTVTLQDNAADTLQVQANGAFLFPADVAQGRTYDIEVADQPVGQLCTVLNGQGVVSDDASTASSVAVVCGNDASVGGTVSGLAAGTSVTLSDGGTLLAIAADGSFAFPGIQAPGTAYQVSVAVQPAGGACAVSNAEGSIQAGVMAVVTVACLPV